MISKLRSLSNRAKGITYANSRTSRYKISGSRSCEQGYRGKRSTNCKGLEGHLDAPESESSYAKHKKGDENKETNGLVLYIDQGNRAVSPSIVHRAQFIGYLNLT